VKSETTHRDLIYREGSRGPALLADYDAMPSNRQDPARDATSTASNEADTAPSVSRIVPPTSADSTARADSRPIEIDGREGPEPTRFGDWERRGRCIDF